MTEVKETYERYEPLMQSDVENYQSMVAEFVGNVSDVKIEIEKLKEKMKLMKETEKSCQDKAEYYSDILKKKGAQGKALWY